jgi:hypothetical protein
LPLLVLHLQIFGNFNTYFSFTYSYLHRFSFPLIILIYTAMLRVRFPPPHPDTVQIK